MTAAGAWKTPRNRRLTATTKGGGAQAAMGFEPMNNGFASRPADSVTTETADTCDGPRECLASCLADSLKSDPDLASVVASWRTLPHAVRAGILAMVRAAAQELS